MRFLRVISGYFTICLIGILSKGLPVLSWTYGGIPRNCPSSRKITDNFGDYDLQEDPLLSTGDDICLYFVPENKAPITITFNSDFMLGYRDETANCSTSFVKFGDRRVSSSFERKLYCGWDKPPEFVSPTGYVWIWIHHPTEYSRLKIHFSSEPKCGGDITMSSSYTIVTAPYLRSNSDCEWSITRRDNVQQQPLLVHITDWNFIYNIFPVPKVKIAIYDGRGGTLLGLFNESSNPNSVLNALMMTTGSTVFITYSSQTPYVLGPLFNITVRVKGTCIPGTFSCGDDERCYSKKQSCDGEVYCPSGYDELGCSPCSPTEFWCGKVDPNICYSAEERCNGYKTCQMSGKDEADCNSCSHGAFLCKTGGKCIYERWLCDGDIDCPDGSDENICSFFASRRVVTAAAIGSLICSLLLVIALGCTCKLYSLRASHHRHPHHHYRATPLTRVERELFSRQAPPTYDMTVTGANTENLGNRSQRNRRRRSRRYQFRRTAPASARPPNGSSRQEGVELTGPRQPASMTTAADQPQQATASPASSTQGTSATTTDQNSNSALSHFGSFLFESMRGQSSSSTATQTQESGTQTNSSGTDSRATPSGSNAGSSSSHRHNRSSSSRSRRPPHGSSLNSNSKEQQAKPLPKKKRILPVMVPAPCPDVIVEQDTLACVYPCPPSYSQAVATDSERGHYNEAMDSEDPEISLNSSTDSQENLDDATQDPDSPSLPGDDSLTTVTRSRFFPFSLKQTMRNLTSASFGRFQKIPYLQMRSQNSRADEGRSSIDSTTNGDDSLIVSSTRLSTSSDEDMLDCTVTVEPQSITNTDAPGNSTTETNLTKVFPERKKLEFFSPKNSSDTSSFLSHSEEE